MKQTVLPIKLYMNCGLFVFSLFFIIGCNPEISQLSTSDPISTETLVTATDISTPVSTMDVSPDAITATPSPTSTPTPHFSATATIMPVPTLTEPEAELMFEDFMATNGECDLPCWWGFQLGESLDSISQRFIGIGLPWLVIGSSSKVDSDQMGTFDASYYDQNGENFVPRLSVGMQFHELDEFIDYIYIFVNRVKFEESQQEFIRDWEQYYLSSFLQKYGKPDQVYFRLRNIADVMDPPQFSVSLLYLEKGLAITYHIRGSWPDDQDGKAELCLDMENVQAIELSLFNPENYDIWGYQFAPYHDELYKPLTWEAEFGMPLATFYETYQNPENLDCLIISFN
ncbi:MAG: hypothetical protein KBE23_19760 [Chloroflexi bacterium]|nr:hypothetical protein [Chloroflexota bacterium]MBP7044998.1 hypothetical protein [Chloroflexota bacterium]